MKPLVALVAVFLLAGCASAGAPDESAEPASSPSASASASPSPTEVEEPEVVLTATEVATQMQIPTVTQIVTIDETNDPNNLIGRPNGYVDGAGLYDSSVPACADLGVDCGATIEVWGDAEGAAARSAYIQELQAASPMLGSEYHYVVENYLLRVSGDILPSVAPEWETAFTAVLAG